MQFFPCKVCGAKFPSYYFVHKHKKLWHEGEGGEGDMEISSSGGGDGEGESEPPTLQQLQGEEGAVQEEENASSH